MKKSYLIVLLAFNFIWYANAQNNSAHIVSASGEVFSNQTNSISFTIGDIVVETRIDSNFILTQGFQQSTYQLTKIDETMPPGFEVTLFPNPVKDALNIHISSSEQTDFTYILFDMNGNMIKSQSFNLKNYQIDMSAFPVGVYILKVSSYSQKVLKSYKIQKF